MATSDQLVDLIKKMDEIQPLAATVAILMTSTVEQETEALTTILEKIKPLLGVAAHSVKTGYNTSGHQSSTEHVHYHDQKGLIIINKFKQECTDGDKHGEYSGWQLILFKDGHFSTLERSGDWSRYQGESSGWDISEEEDITVSEAVRRYGLKDILTGIASELSDASGKLQIRKKSYEERLATIAMIKEVMQ